jgi:uncharacterized membrane protein YcaP (DUF421 family)
MTGEELRSKLRQLGADDPSVVLAAILEPDGALSVRFRPVPPRRGRPNRAAESG